MNTVTGLEKKLNQVSRQLKALLQLIAIVIVLITFISGFYRSFSQDRGVQEAVVPTPTPQPSLSPSPRVRNLEAAFVDRVIDGDTVRLDDGRAVRYIGVDTPETVAPNRPVECFGREASEFNRQLVENKTVWLEKDVSETDRYDRLLRYVYLDPVASLSAQVNFILVEQGYAYASSFPPDVKWQEELLSAQQQAQITVSGLWKSCQLE